MNAVNVHTMTKTVLLTLELKSRNEMLIESILAYVYDTGKRPKKVQKE